MAIVSKDSSSLQIRKVKAVDIGKAVTKSSIKNLPPAVFQSVPGVNRVFANLAAGLWTTGIEAYDNYLNEQVKKEQELFRKVVNFRLKELRDNQVDYSYFHHSLIYRIHEVLRKIASNPGKGYAEIYGELIANLMTKSDFPPDARDIVLSTAIELDVIDIRVLEQLDVQFVANLRAEKKLRFGVKREILEQLLKSSRIDGIMISRSIARLEGQDLVSRVGRGSGVLDEAPDLKDLYEGKKTSIVEGSFITTSYGRRFLRALGKDSSSTRTMKKK